MIFGFLHCFFPAFSPVYVAKGYFDYLPSILLSWEYHNHCLWQQNLFLTKGVEAFEILKKG